VKMNSVGVVGTMITVHTSRPVVSTFYYVICDCVSHGSVATRLGYDEISDSQLIPYLLWSIWANFDNNSIFDAVVKHTDLFLLGQCQSVYISSKWWYRLSDCH